MPKAKLKMSATEKGKLINAAELSDVTLTEIKTIGTEAIASVKFRSPSDLFSLGRYFAVVSNEIPKEVVSSEKKK